MIVKKMIIVSAAVFLCLVLFMATGCKNEGVITTERSRIQEDSIEKDGREKSQDKEGRQDRETTEEEKQEVIVKGEGESGILYQLSKHNLFSYKSADEECFSLNFYEYLDAGIIDGDGSDNLELELRDFPTSMVKSKQFTDYYYIFSLDYPVMEKSGFEMFNWDLENQDILKTGFDSGEEEYIQHKDNAYPGDLEVSAGNRYLVYVMTEKSDAGMGFITPRFDPFLDDSKLMIKENNGKELTVLESGYNRQLFGSFSDFTNSDEYFYTLLKKPDEFQFIRISLETGEVDSFEEVFGMVDWSSIVWDEFFPRSNDMSYAYFAISPDEERLVAYKNYYSTNMDNPCYTESSHRLWLFNLENGNVDISEKHEGYVSDVSWEPDGQGFALAVMSHCGCYPGYLDARIEIFDKGGNMKSVLVDEPESKITRLGWSPDGDSIAYDLYGMDFTGRLKLVKIDDGNITELINTIDISGSADDKKPVLILFSEWVKK